MDRFPDLLFWTLILSVPVGLAAAAFWAKKGRRQKRPVVAPGEPGNPD